MVDVNPAHIPIFTIPPNPHSQGRSTRLKDCEERVKALEAQLEEAKRQEYEAGRASVLAATRSIVETCGFTPKEIFPGED